MDDLERRLATLREAPVPDQLGTAVMARLKEERRLLGLPVREWAVVGGALLVFSVGIQLLVTWASSQMVH